LITLVYVFLDGEITMRFVLKVAIVLLVASAVFVHFMADMWGFWTKYPSRARSVGIATGILVVLSIAAGFVIVGSPSSVRLQRLDEQKINDLQNIQYSITSFYQSKGRLPDTLAETVDPLGG